MQKEPRLSDAKQKLLEIQSRMATHLPANPSLSELQDRSPKIPAPLSLAQEQVWHLDQIAGGLAPLHNESITIHLNGPCDPALLERSLAEIIKRHEIWRTTYEVASGQPIQIVHPHPATFKLPAADLRTMPERDRENQALDLASGDARKPFDLQHGPLLRMRLVTLDDFYHRLYLTAHQSIVDGISVFDIFPSELTKLYESFASGQPSPLPELEIQYADFSRSQRRRLAGGQMENQLAYWQRQLAGELPVLPWPRGVRPVQQTYRGAIYPFKLNRELTHSLKQIGQREGATLFMVLLAGLVSLLHRYTGQDDIIIGTLAPSGRKPSECQRLLGYFLNPVALRANLSGNPTFSALVAQMRDVTLAAISNDDVPLELIAERLHLKRDPSRSLFFTVALSLAPNVPQLSPGWSMTYMDVESGGARWDLYIEMSDRAEGLIGRAQYNPDLFTTAAIKQTVEDFRLLLEEFAAVREL